MSLTHHPLVFKIPFPLTAAQPKAPEWKNSLRA